MLGDIIGIVRRNADLSSKDLADRVGITPQALSSYEKNTRNPPFITLAKICRVLRIDLNQLAEFVLKDEEKH